MRFIRKRKRLFKAISAFTAVNILVELIAPSIAFGLTSGPNQPEFTGFSAVNTNELVDPFTGDFNYSVNLMTLPGFEAGIPITLNYQAGVTMEQEASWVGLGWNLNTGAINRQVRGLPDDFSGTETIKRTRYQKPNTSFIVSANWNAIKEICGADGYSDQLMDVGPEFSGKIFYNNYNGMGYGAGLTISTALQENGSEQDLSGKLNFSIDSQSGASVGAGLKYGKGKSNWGGNLNLGLSSRDGVENIGFGITRKLNYKTKYKDGKENLAEGFSPKGSTTAGLSYAVTSMIPSVNFPMKTTSLSANVETGISVATITSSLKSRVTFVRTKIAENDIHYPALGYLYSQKNDDSGKYMMDFNRENNSAVTTTSKVIPVTVATSDIYSVSAPGFSDQMRFERSDHGIYRDPKKESISKSFGGGLDLDPAVTEIKFGVNGQVSYGKSYSGGLNEGEVYKLTNKFGFKNSSASVANGFYQPATLVSASNISVNHASNPGSKTIASGNPLRTRIKRKALKMNIVDEMANKSGSSNYNNYSSTEGRKKRATTYQYYTHRDIDGTNSSFSNKDQIKSIVATVPGGKVYEYANPVYNIEKSEVVMSVNHNYTSKGLGPYTTYSSTQASNKNESGDDNLFDETQTPIHAYSYLLSSIKSNDYVDLTGDKLSPDDFGQYVKYSYTNHFSKSTTPYRWRIPFEKKQANLSVGSLSTGGDDKASYTYGAKEIKYTKNIETKTHVVTFELTNRNDGLPVLNKEGGKAENIARLQRLKSVSLWVKGDNYQSDNTDKVLVKRAHFEYNYELCEGIPNFSKTGINKDPDYKSSTLTGKLTLKKVYFTYRNNANSNSKSSPYVFDYHAGVATENPNYELKKVNNWGHYQPYRFDVSSATSGYNNVANLSYPHQAFSSSITKDMHDDWAGAWNLKTITLPSGGEIDIDYEQDDYGFVQNQEAMVMAKIVGFSKTSSGDISGVLSKNRQFLIIDIPGNSLTPTEVTASLSGFKQLYFKALVRLKALPQYPEPIPYKYSNTPGVDPISGGVRNVWDYVEGYCKTKVNRGKYTGSSGAPSGFTRAFLEIENVFLSEGYGTETNPIKKAALQFLRYKEPLLLAKAFPMPEGNSIPGLLKPATFILNTLIDFAGIFAGYYNTSAARGYANRFGKDNDKFPSFVRVRAPKKTKIGGGYRVARITMNDKWADMSPGTSSGYTQEFIYKNYDGTSSGVATFEPGVFGEENPLRQPIVYGTKKILYRDNNMYVEEPLGSSFYPGPSVGYGQVIIKNKSHTGINYAADGIKVKQFYTAKDFPVQTKRTDLATAHFKPIPITVPFIGSITTTNLGFSQGVSVETNDMHGKSKADYVMPYRRLIKAEENNASTQFKTHLFALKGSESSSIKYDYFLKGNEDYIAGTKNYLSSKVKVLEGEQVLEKELGKTVEFYGSTHEDKSFSISGGLDYNHHQVFSLPLPALWPNLSETYQLYRDVSMTKVINRKGLLKRIIAFDGDAEAVTENLIFDDETGVVLLSTVNNEYGDPIYSLDIKGHNEGYKQMNGAYSNIDLVVDLTSNTLASYGNSVFVPGDVFVKYGSNNKLDMNQTYWYESSSSFRRKSDNAQVTSLPAAKYRIVRSGNRNLQNVSVGNILSLSNPIGGDFPLDISGVLNYTFLTSNGIFKTVNPELSKMKSCDGTIYNVPNIQYVSHEKKLIIWGDGSVKLLEIVFNNALPVPFASGTLSYDNNTGSVIFTTPSNVSYTGYPTAKSTLKTCHKILHAESTEFTNTADFHTYKWVTGNKVHNPYRYGEKGVYRPSKTFVYRTDRRPETIGANVGETDIRTDGEYKKFVKFSHPINNVSQTNTDWYNKAEATRFSPYSGEIESKNPLGIYASAIFGYSGLLPLAVSQNSEYKEFAYSGFEEQTAGGISGNSTVLKGHLGTITNVSNGSFSSAESHTGKKSIKVTANGSLKLIFTSNGVTLKNNEKYVVSMWVKKNTGGTYFNLIHFNSSGNQQTIAYDTKKTNIEGWQQMEFEFIHTNGGTGVFLGSNATFYVDDIRIYPADGAMKSYVYNRDYMTLAAELDERNFATFYNYDEAGNLVQIKKETERGIMTIQTQRKANYTRK